MNDTAELLHFICQNARMGVETVNHLTDIMKDTDFRDLLRHQLAEYQAVLQEAEAGLRALEEEVPSLSTMAKTMSYLGILRDTLFDKSTSHIAEMMIQGSTMGVVQITKKIKDYPAASPHATALAERLLRQEQFNIDQLKKHL